MVGGAEGRVVVYCPGQSVGERLQRIVQQPHEGGVCGPGSFRFVTGGQGFGSGIPAVLESGEVAQRDRVQNAGRIRRRTWAGLRYAPSAPSSITKPTDSHKHWYIKRGQAMIVLEGAKSGGLRPDIDIDAAHRLGRCLIMANDFLFTPEHMRHIRRERPSINRKRIALQLQVGSGLEVNNPPTINTSIVRSEIIFGEILTKISCS